ncbi:MAG: hypothetical protein KIT22_10390 [Verrucomicrobiae bacterium]|nr:hypothetical protein [Verrucomicrobiae bacterium]
MSRRHGHELADQLGLTLDQAIADKIRSDPKAIDLARANLCRWRQQAGGISAAAHQEWERVLRFLTPPQVADFVVSRTPMAARLSQSSPFAGILTEEERLKILREHAA